MSDEKLSVSALASIAENEPQILQTYADRVVNLEFIANESAHHKLFKNLSFPNLETLWLDASDHNDDASLGPYLQPKLKRFIFYGGPISDVFLDKMQASCPLLEELLIDNPRDLISPEGFLRFLDGARALKRVSVMYGMSRAITDSVVVALATKPGLEILEFQELITEDLASKIVTEQARQGTVEKLFPQLRELVCVAESGGLTNLLLHLSGLSRLDVNVVYKPIPSTPIQDCVIHNIGSHCINLQTLKLEYGTKEGQHIHLTPEALIRLAKLNKLEELGILGNRVEAPMLRDTHIASMMEVQQQLKALRLMFSCQLTESALAEAAKHGGAKLEELDLYGTYNLLNLAGRDVSLPQLLSLELRQLASSSVTDDAKAAEAVAIAQLLKKMAPKLEYFDVISPSILRDMILDELDEE
ncbi:uncharacterized protein F4812DRAFT_241838 [Daldinia caldariorum]|uniref:uncharacterized protein n=1 Tax=Daldinia caldariorum TaxID=326644 RepID=UPI002008D147|nr:uncharacterized protein F4812DRAFT_241838 [Daldinia caldariorum]KAI1463515.1 hypothetical protein F4812DRAFT_241838 [Daldinia caldariorum]